MPLVPSNINEMIQSINRSGIAYSNRYELMFGIPNLFPSGNPGEMRSLTVRCDSVTVPGRGFSTTPYRFYGPARNMPYEPIYAGEMNISMILSADLRERKFFEDWMNFVCSRDNFKFGYYDDYTTDLQINVFGKDETPTYAFFVEEVYPKSIGDLQMGYDKENDYLRQDVTLSFRKYTPQYIGMPPIPTNTANTQFINPAAFLQSGIGGILNSGTLTGIGRSTDPQQWTPPINTPR